MREDGWPLRRDTVQPADLARFAPLGPRALLALLASNLCSWQRVGEMVCANLYPRASAYLRIISAPNQIVDRRLDMLAELRAELVRAENPGPDVWMCIARLVIERSGRTNDTLYGFQTIWEFAEPEWIAPYTLYGSLPHATGRSSAPESADAVAAILDANGIP